MTKDSLIASVVLVASTILMLILLPIIFLWGIWTFNSLQLRISSPVSLYLVKQKTMQETDVFQFFEKSTSKAEALALLSVQEYNLDSMLRARPIQDLEPNQYRFDNYGLHKNWVWVNVHINLEFDENNELVSATGGRSQPYK